LVAVHSLAVSRSPLVTIVTGLKDFPYGDIKSATKNFSKDKLIAEGGFGKVYKVYMCMSSSFEF
jgi:hypothetical protein